VAIPANTFFATFEAVAMAGCVPVIVDIDEDYCIDIVALAQLEGIDAVIPVHLYGLPADMQGLMAMAEERGWWILEDASQAHGAHIGNRPVGSLGHVAAFSAYPTKNLGAWGDAGFVTGSDPQIERKIRSLRHHAQETPHVHQEIGGTHRMDNIHALVLLEKLGHLGEEIVARRRIAAWYRDALAKSNVALPDDVGDRQHAFHQFVVRTDKRDHVRKLLNEAGIGTMIHYPTPIHQQPGAVGSCEVPRPLRRTTAWASQLLSLPIYNGVSEADVERVARIFCRALNT
jgi:dTDP-4-amino-4,6-dideoxygalactose transaminase